MNNNLQEDVNPQGEAYYMPEYNKHRSQTLETTLSSVIDCDDDYNYDNEEFKAATQISAKEGNPSMNNNNHITTHYIILSHGWLGSPQEMAYVQQAIESKISSMDDSFPQSVRVVVHSATSNHKRTHDGIANGGKRLANEIESFILNDLLMTNNGDDNGGDDDDDDGSIFCTQSRRHIHVGLSIIGYSLGGLYGRYALSCLPSQLTAVTKNEVKMNIMLHYNIFMTIATPHLACTNHTYMNLPRFVEWIFGSMCSKTGKDLFCSKKITRRMKKKQQSVVNSHKDENNLIFEMGTNYETFLKPLSQFKKRVTYVNAFQTDFQVPTSTAAFLSDDSTHPHFLRTSTLTESDDCPFVVAMLQTRMDNDVVQSDVNLSSYHDLTKHAQDLIMSNKLDALGWDKIFIDSRDMNPIPGVPKGICSKDHRLGWKNYCQDFIEKPSKDNEEFQNDTSSFQLHSSSIKSKDVKHFMTKRGRKIQIPVGHCMLIANSKSKGAEKFYSNGRQIVDVMVTSFLGELL